MRASSFRSDHGSGDHEHLQRRIGLPNPAQAIPRSSDVFESPNKRRKTNESMPPLARSQSHNQFGSPASYNSLPLQSPSFSLSGLHSQPLNRPLSAHGSTHNSTHSFDFASLLGSTRLSDHQVPDTSTADLDQSGIGSNNFNGDGTGLTPADGPYDLLSPRFWTQQSVWGNASLQEACLMRYFVENLAHWVGPAS